jgi:predicted porin
MKKIAISALLIGFMGLAQADVTVYGMGRVYEESSTVGTAASVTSLTNDKSRIGFKAGDNLGDGLSAFAQIEVGVGIDSPTASTLGDRIAQIGLKSEYGTLGLGRDKTSLTKALDSFDAMGGDLFGSSAATIHSYQGTRLSNGIFVTSNTFVDGLTANYVLSNSEVAGTPNPYTASLVFAAGPVGLTYARYDNGVSSLTNAYGAKYTFAKTGTTLFGLYSDDTVSGVNTTGKSFGVSQVVMPKLTAMASYGEVSSTKAYNVGLNYDLGKNTKVLARYLFEDAASDTTRYGVGLEYSF